MKNNVLTILLVVAITIILATIGSYILKVDHGSGVKNPFELNIDSIGNIDKSKFCNLDTSSYTLPILNSYAIAVNKNDNIYLSGDNEIIVFTKPGDKKNTIKTDGTATALAIDKNNVVYAAMGNRIVAYALDGSIKNQWSVNSTKAIITSLAVGNSIFVADANEAVVYEYDVKGTLIKTIGSKNKDDNDCFILPSKYFDLAIGPDSSLWVANPGKHFLVNFKKDGSIKSSWGNASANLEDFCGCCNPSHFAIGSDGSFITSEKGLVRVKKYNASGIFECAIAGPQHFEAGATGLDIAIGSDNTIFILEPKASVIHIFKEKSKE